MSEFCLLHDAVNYRTCLRPKGHDGEPHIFVDDRWIADTEISHDLAYGLGHKEIAECCNAYPRRWKELVPEAFTD